MEIRALGLEGVFELRPERHSDQRGFLSETWSACAMTEVGINLNFVQDNHSYSELAGTLRGLHFQRYPWAQAKLVRVVRGAIFDVVVDIRCGASTFGHWIGTNVSRDAWNQIFVPAGYAHGFVTLESGTEVVYKVDAAYSPGHDCAIRFDDPTIGIEWPEQLAPFQLSDKDASAPLLADLDVGCFRDD